MVQCWKDHHTLKCLPIFFQIKAFYRESIVQIWTRLMTKTIISSKVWEVVCFLILSMSILYINGSQMSFLPPSCLPDHIHSTVWFGSFVEWVQSRSSHQNKLSNFNSNFGLQNKITLCFQECISIVFSGSFMYHLSVYCLYFCA